MSKPTVYIETTVLSLLTARPTRDIVQTAWQQITNEWWVTRRQKFDLFISEGVIVEAQAGDADAAKRRLAALKGLPALDITKEVEQLAGTLAKALALPPKKKMDAVHIAACAVHGVDFLLTWNCTHLANPVLEAEARRICVEAGYVCPMICTPHQLLEMEL